MLTSYYTKYQAAKATTLVDYISIMNASLPREPKKLGNSIKIREDWNNIKLTMMEQCLIEKFSLPHLMKKLLDTGDAILIEGTTGWCDCFWGICYCDRCDGIGQNHLGKLLMKIRDKFLTVENVKEY